MREILFRGKRIDNGERVEGYLVKANGKAYIIWDDDAWVESIYGENQLSCNSFFEVDPETVGQYINREDKNENMIFEGDIVLGKTVDDKYFSGIVKFDNASFYVDECGTTSYYAWMNYEVEVLDNIYDNPETTEVEADTTINLCDTCKLSFATCHPYMFYFGNGKGNDNVFKCTGYQKNGE